MAITLLGTKGMKSFGRYGAVGFELLASIAVGYYLGHWLDGKFGTRWLSLIGFLLGCYAGFRSLFRAAKQMTRDIAREEALARGEDPWAKPDADDDEPGDQDDEPESAGHLHDEAAAGHDQSDKENVADAAAPTTKTKTWK